jgi:hypothetical protein
MILFAIGWGFVAATGMPPASAAPRADLATVLEDNDSVRRLRELAPYIEGLRPDEIAGVVRKVQEGHGPGRENLLDVVAGRWVEIDPAAAMAFARRTDDREAKGAIETAYYGAWAERDPEGALAAANRASSGERGNAIWQIAHKMGERDPSRANELIASVHAVQLENSDYFIFWNWTQKDLGQATRTLVEEAKIAGPSYPREAAAWAMADRLLENDPKAATKWVTQLPPGKVRDEAFERVASEWAKVDSGAANAWLKSLPASDPMHNETPWVSPQYSAAGAPVPIKPDPSFAAKGIQLNAILRESNSWRELETLLPFVDGLSAAEFPQVLERLRNMPDSNRNEVTDVLVARWMDVDPAGAIKAISQARAIHDSEFSQRFLTDLYSAWSQRDPDAAFAAATRDSHGVGNCDVLSVVFAALARQDPLKAYAAFRKLNDANSHMLVIPIFTEWAVTDLPAATKVLADEGHWQGAIEGVVRGLMRKDRASAIAWAKQLPTEKRRSHALREVADHWSFDDPAAAMAWLENSPSFGEKYGAMDDVAVEWVVRNTMEALRHALTLPDDREKSSLLSWGLGQLTYDDAEAAARWVQHLPAGEMKERSRGEVLAYWEEYDPPAAASYLSSVAAEATPGDVASVAGSWSNLDSVPAVRWLDTFPASLNKAPAIGAIAKNWYRADPSAAASWVNQMPAGPLYDAGAKGLSEGSPFNDVVVKQKWAESIGDPKLRHDQTFAVFYQSMQYENRWIAMNDTKAEAAIKSSSLSDTEKKQLLDMEPKLVVFPYPKHFEKKPAMQ